MKLHDTAWRAGSVSDRRKKTPVADAPGSPGRRGLTLVELLVVLVILVILATVAIQSTENLVAQARYESTQRTLDNIQNAVLGPRSQMDSDGTRAVTGFVADMGRLPVAVAGTNPSTGLPEMQPSELWI